VNTLLGILKYPLAHQIGWALLHSLWLGSLVGAVFVLLRFTLRRRSANARYLAGCFSLGLLLAILVLLLLSGPAPSPAPDPRPSEMSAFAEAAVPVFSFAARQIAYTWNAPGKLWHGGVALLGQLAPLLTAAWLLGVAFFSARLAKGCWWVRNLRIRDNEPLEAAWLETLNDLRRRLRVSRPVGLLKSALVEVPTVIGWLRPVILVPAATLSGLTPRQLEAILAHELAHVRRHDYVVNAFQCLVETLMFYHPVAWWISRCIREERENCCDDLVIEVCGDRLTYARALAAMEGLRGELPELAFAATGGSLLNRIRRLLGVSRECGAVSIRQLSGMALLGIGLLLIALGARLALASPAFSSTVRIRVDRDQSEGVNLADHRGSPAYDPYFSQTEFEVIESEVILDKVIEALDLNREWGKRYAEGGPLRTSETMNLLKGRLELRVVRNTSLIEIRAISEKPDEAAKIVNAIAEAHQAYRRKQREQLTGNGLKALEARVAEQQEKVKQAQQAVDKLRVDLRISDAESSVDGPAPMMTADTLRKLEGLRIERKAEYDREATILARLKGLRSELGPEGMAQAIPTAVPDTVLSAFLEHLGTAEQQLASLSKEFGPQHAEFVKVQSQVEDLRSKIKQRADGILLGLDAKVQSLSNSLDNFNQEVARATSNDVFQADRARPYFEAKRNLEELQHFRQVLDMKIANEKVDAALPKSSLVELVDRAVPSLRPVSPNLPLAVALIVFGILLDIAGLLALKGGSRQGSLI
jgi:beta-lactamase regulating signal transducer with metallopeptidase domain